MPSCSAKCGSGNQRLVSGGTATHKERFGRETGGDGLGIESAEGTVWSARRLDGGMTAFDTRGMIVYIKNG